MTLCTSMERRVGVGRTNLEPLEKEEGQVEVSGLSTHKRLADLLCAAGMTWQ